MRIVREGLAAHEQHPRAVAAGSVISARVVPR
jgi:hypothetical protein